MKRAVRKFKETVDIRSRWLHRARSHRYFPAALLVSVFLMACCVHVWQRVQVLDLVKEVSHLKRVNAELSDGSKKLNADIATLTSAARIELYATDTLGLCLSSTARLVTLQPHEREVTPAGQWTDMKNAVKRIAQHLPVVTVNSARARELKDFPADTVGAGGGN